MRLVLLLFIACSLPALAQKTSAEVDTTTIDNEAIDTFGVERLDSLPTYTSVRRFVNKIPAENNDMVIGQYNRFEWPGHGSSAKESWAYTAVFGVKKNSHMSTDDIEVNIVKKWVTNPLISDKDDRVYFLVLKNKSDKPIYVDKRNSFRIDRYVGKIPYFNRKLGKDAGDSIIVIEPHKEKNLSDYRYVKRQGGYIEFVEEPERFEWLPLAIGLEPGYLYHGQIKTFPEDNSPYYITFQIAYSDNSDFSTYSRLSVNTYIRQLVGVFHPEIYQENERKKEGLGFGKYALTSCVDFYNSLYLNRPDNKNINIHMPGFRWE